ncbi:EAL and HDOD domain-containing protein [Sporosarcina sp. OR05]|uniref:EAL and HDOD domain-containing protein n=1 Tax=Sporosarcina sp. OR05 TaxID=2969819 RepID=UPI00352A1345
MEVNVFVGRQPILDREGQIFGYELLYRNSEENRFPAVNPESATLQVLMNSFLSIGIDNVAESYKSFINFSGELLIEDIFSRLSPARVIIEILEDVEITSILIHRMKEIKQHGYQFALDDFIMQDQYAQHTDLFALIDYVKVDFLAVNEVERKNIEIFIKKYPHIRMVAEKIETEAQFLEAKASGYDLFQGYFFAKPEIIKGVDIPSTLSSHSYILHKLSEEDADIDEVVELIVHDMSITYKLLRFINTMHFGVPKKVGSVKQAVILIGFEHLKKWMRILLVHHIGEHSSSGQVKALVSFSLTRARMCELIAKRIGKENSDEYFFVGMFSLMDVIMNKSWDDILPLIPFSESIANTLKGEETEMTTVLQLAIATEKLDWSQIRNYRAQLGISEKELSEFSRMSIRWAQQLDESYVEA